jgi:hypothetical protein
MGLQFALILTFLISFHVHSSDIACSSNFFPHIEKTSPLSHAFPENLIQGNILERAEELVSRWPKNLKFVDDVIVKVSTPAGELENKKKFLVISFDGLSDNQIEKLKKEYIESLSHNAISMPLGKSTGHLYTRVGSKVYDHDISGFKNADYDFSLLNERMETFLTFSDEEFLNFRQYVQNIESHYSQTIGDFSINGPMESDGLIQANRGKGCAHNCTTWLSLAPIGSEGQTLKSLVRGKNFDIHRDPGWWNLYLQTKSSNERNPFVVYMADKSFAEIEKKVSSHQVFDWNYNLAK